MVNASEYTLGVEEEDRHTYEIVNIRPYYAVDFLLVTGNEEVGDTKIVQVIEIKQSGHSSVGYWWSISLKDFDNNLGWVFSTYQKPEQAMVPVPVYYVCPLPVVDYLTELVGALDAHYKATTSGRTYTVTRTTSPFILATEQTFTYDATTGWLTEVVFEDENGIALKLVEVEDSGISGYEFPILLSIGAVTMVGIIYSINKKRK